MLISRKRKIFLFYIGFYMHEMELACCYGRPVPPDAGLAPIQVHPQEFI